MSSKNPAKCEVQSVIHFHAKGKHPVKIYKEIVSVYRNRQNVMKSSWAFSSGSTNVHEEPWTGKASVIFENSKKNQVGIFKPFAIQSEPGT